MANLEQLKRNLFCAAVLITVIKTQCNKLELNQLFLKLG